MNFCRISNEAAQAKGLFNDDREEAWARSYEIFNEFNPATDGFTFDELQGCWAVWMGKYMAIKAEMGIE